MHPLMPSNRNDSEIVDRSNNMASLREKPYLNHLYYNPIKKRKCIK